MTLNKLRGKSLDEVRAKCADLEKAELTTLLWSALSVEPLYRASEIAVLTKRPRRVVLDDMNAGKMGDLYVFGKQSLAVAASGVNAWRAQFRVSATR